MSEPSTSNKEKPSPVDNKIIKETSKPSISTGVIIKLLFFSALLFAAPIATYFYSVDTIFSGNRNYAAGAAALVANLVVILYILAAMVEDMQNNKPKKD
ncbi:unnamed protein product [Cunninghamella blakesleeana]